MEERRSSERPRWNLRRFGETFRHGAHSVRKTIREEAIEQMRRARRVPSWVRITHKLYHDYGLKHLCLISVLIAYQFFGAAVFYLCEHKNEQTKEREWNTSLQLNRTALIQKIVSSMFNNTDYLFFLTQGQTDQVESRLEFDLKTYEQRLGVKFRERKTKWDFWGALLYAQMICTTIGGGFVRLYPSTTEGRAFTMLYALFGVPLVLTVLDDLGKLLTKFLKVPWYWTKCACRRIFSYCTKQTLAEIRRLDAEDKRDLELSELPIFVAIFVVVLWLFICSATFCIWETDWNWFISFYFFFISLSTIGIGDISPSHPTYLLILFVYIIIGLSLVSSLVNAIQMRLERTYQTGQHQMYTSSTVDSQLHQKVSEFRPLRRNCSSLGVLKGMHSSCYSINREAVRRYFAQKQSHNKSSQTLLSFPSPTRNSVVSRSVFQNRIFPRTLSIDDVMKLVDTEEGDILLLTELTRDESQLSELSEAIRSDISRDSSVNQLVISKSFDSNFNPPQTVQQQQFEATTYLPSFFSTSKALPRQQQAQHLTNCPSTVPIPMSLDLETIEEIEDLLLLRSGSFDANPTVHFRSRLSLVNEEECGAESSLSTSTTEQTISSHRDDSQRLELDKNANRSQIRRNRAERTARSSRQNNSMRSSLLPAVTSSNNNYQQRSSYSKPRR